MMLGRGNKQQLRGKRYTEKVAKKKKKDHNSDQGIIQGSIS